MNGFFLLEAPPAQAEANFWAQLRLCPVLFVELRGNPKRFFLDTRDGTAMVGAVAGAPWIGAKGKAVKIGRGRAAVTGDDRRNKPLPGCGCRVGRRGGSETRKPENLPATCLVWLSRSGPSGSLGVYVGQSTPGARTREAGAFCWSGRSRLAATCHAAFTVALFTCPFPSQLPTMRTTTRLAPWPHRRPESGNRKHNATDDAMGTDVRWPWPPMCPSQQSEAPTNRSAGAPDGEYLTGLSVQTRFYRVIRM